MMALDQLRRGFTDPARDAQSAFRAILHAMAHPGRIETLSVEPDAPEGRDVGTAAVTLTLLDEDSTVWISESLREAAAQWLSFHCRCPIVESDALNVAFAVIASGDAYPALDTALLDDPQRPDLSTTLILECAALTGGPALRVTGPGIRGEAIIAPSGVGGNLWQQRNDLRSLLPLGVDIILTAGSQIMALPRTTLVEEQN
jgi:alpha-D-ribose 1-methylphosphonate 5-triphosphate synthase subunit PhnH